MAAHEEGLAAGRLEQSVERLERAIAERVEPLDSEIESLKSRLESVQAEKDALTAALRNANVEYRVLESVTDTVRDRLDGTIGRLREVLSA